MSPGSSRNLVLTGFMGSGKTAAGEIVAARLGRPFVDTDRLIAEQAGRSIADLFQREGEAHFRQLEAELCRALGRQGGLVIATGGWTLGPEANRAALAENGLLMCLTAGARELAQRLAGQGGRPLLAGDDWRLQLELLLARRQPAYRQIALQVETGGLRPEQVAEQVLALWQTFGERGAPRAVPVAAPAPGYQVLVGHGLLDQLGVLLRAAVPRFSGAAIVTDDQVGPLYTERARQALGIRAREARMPAGEKHKTLDTVRRLYDQLLEAGLDRSGVVVALGGGVVGDVAGFVAATYLRGVRLVQVPTTLLAMVDSSVGAKTGVDLPQGKNLVGAFKQPELVVADPDVLATLPEVEVQSGLAEVVKHGVIGDAGLFEALEAGAWQMPVGGPEAVEWIARAVAVKRGVVEDDPFEEGRRAVLNLGHTFGHALEQRSGYELRHGQAVAIGLVAAAEVAARLKMCERTLPERIRQLLRRLGLPTGYRGLEPGEVLAAMGTDKKRRGRQLHFVLPQALGRVVTTDRVPQQLVLDVLTRLKEEG